MACSVMPLPMNCKLIAVRKAQTQPHGESELFYYNQNNQALLLPCEAAFFGASSGVSDEQ